MKINQYEARDFQAASAPISIPDRSRTWDTVIAAGNYLQRLGHYYEDQKAERDGERAGYEAQAKSDPDTLAKAPEGMFGPTVRGTAFDKAAELAQVAQKKSQTEKSLYEIGQKFGHDPERFKQEVGSLRDEVLKGVPLHRQPAMSFLFDQQALQEQRTVDRAAMERQMQDNIAAINGRVDTALTTMNNLIAQDPIGNEEKILSLAGEIDTILDEASRPTKDARSVLSPARVQEFRQKTDTMIAKNLAFAEFKANNHEGRLALIERLRNGEYRLPMLGKDGNVLVDQGRQIPIEDARRIANEIEEQATKQTAGQKMALAQLKLSLGEQTAATTATMTVHPELERTLSVARSLGRADLLDDVRKAEVALSVTRELRPLALQSPEAIRAAISAKSEAVRTGTSRDVFRDSEYVDQARKLLSSKQTAIDNGTETQWLYERGLIRAVPALNPDDPRTIESARQARLEAEAITGRPQPIADDAFITRSKQILETGTAEDKTRLLEFVSAMPRNHEERARLFSQLGRTNPELGQLAHYFSATNEDGTPDAVKRAIARDAMKGLERYKLNPADTVKEQGAYRAIDKLLAPYINDPTQLAATRRMAFGLMVENAHGSDRLYSSDGKEFNGTEVKRAVLRLIGASDDDIRAGRVPTINSAPVVPFERGMSENQMRLIWNSLGDDELKAMNGGRLPVDHSGMEISAAQIRDRARLRYTGKPGEYFVVYTDPRFDDGAYPAASPDTPLLSGDIRGGRPAPFRFVFNATTREALTAATRRVKGSPNVLSSP